MSNNLFSQLGGGNNPMSMIQQFMQFRNNFKGNPQEEVQKILSSGRFSQQQINHVQNMANQLQMMMKMMK